MSVYRTFAAALGLVIISSSVQLKATPSNDLFANRGQLTGSNITVQGNNSGAGEESGEDIGPGNVLWVYTVWYTWTAPTNGVVHLSGSTSAYDFIMSIRAYRGTAVNALTLAPTMSDESVPVAAGDTIQIQVGSVYYAIWGGGGGTGPFTLTLWLEVPMPASANDLFAERVEVTTPSFHFAGSIYGATNEPSEPLPNANAQQTLWWKFIAPGNGILQLSVSAPQFTSWMSVYEGSLFPSMTRVTPWTESQYNLQGGHEYSIQMTTTNVPVGTFTLDTRFYSSSNDMFAGAEHLEGTNITYTGNYGLATFEAGEPPTQGTNTVWAAWEAPFTGRVTFDQGGYWWRHCDVYTGPTLGLLKREYVATLVNQVYSFVAVEGTVYYLQFSGDGTDFPFHLNLSPFPEVTNDNFADAQVVKGQAIYFDPKPVMGATMELGEPLHVGAVPQKSIWWKWQAPLWGTLYLDTQSSLATNVTLAVYTGSSVDTLKLAGKGTRYFQMSVNGGQTYYIAGAVPTNSVGDIVIYLQYNRQNNGSHPVAGNLLQEPSWEGTSIYEAQYWHWTGSLGGYVNEFGGVDGTTWPNLGSGATIWQEFPTTPGHAHTIHFAFMSSASSAAHVRVLWDTNVVGTADIPSGEGFWHWGDFTTVASNSTSRITFQNVGGQFENVDMDAFSVVDASTGPAIVTQPSSASTVGGGTVAFIVGATGSAPLAYQWFLNGVPLSGKTDHVLIWDSVSTNETGSYSVIITNGFGSVTSAAVSLFVEAPTYPTIVWQPYGDTVTASNYYRFSVAAIGSQPLRYQWFFNDELMTDATNNTLILANVQPADAGTYRVTVQNAAGTVWSLPAPLRIGETNSGGGTINFRNSFYYDGTNVNALIFDVDGVTPLTGTAFAAQLYAGPSLEWLRPAGVPRAFRTGFGAGSIYGDIVTLGDVGPGSNCVVQMRVWDAAKANSYEEARALGGRFGKSEILATTAGDRDTLPPGYLVGLRSFSLQAGLPRFTSGTIQRLESIPPDNIVWSITGEPGYRYLVEKATQDLVWRPYVVVTNVTGTVTFSDSASSTSGVTLYRSRILD